MNYLRIRPGIHRCAEVRPRADETLEIFRANDQRIPIGLVQPGQGPGQVADVGADAEIAGAANVDDDVEHRVSSGAFPLFCRKPAIYRAILFHRTKLATKGGTHHEWAMKPTGQPG